MSNIFIENYRFIIKIFCSMSRLLKREKICKALWTETQRDTRRPDWSLAPTDNCFQLLITTDTFSKYANFYISKFKIAVVRCYLTKLLRHLTRVANFTVFPFIQSNWWQDLNLFYLHSVFLCWSLMHSLELFNLTYIFAYLTANWKTRGPTKRDNEIIYTINYHGNWFII